jgi:hypothetical protein
MSDGYDDRGMLHDDAAVMHRQPAEYGGMGPTVPGESWAYRHPDRWEDLDPQNGARPVWDIAGRVFAGPMFSPAGGCSIRDRNARVVRLFHLLHLARLAAAGKPQPGHFLGLDGKGRYRIE